VTHGFLFCFLVFALLFATLLTLRTRLLGLEEEVERIRLRSRR
jgi:hypothetical protein